MPGLPCLGRRGPRDPNRIKLGTGILEKIDDAFSKVDLDNSGEVDIDEVGGWICGTDVRRSQTSGCSRRGKMIMNVLMSWRVVGLIWFPQFSSDVGFCDYWKSRSAME